LGVLQAFPSEELFKKFYSPDDEFDKFEQRIPETDEEFDEIASMMEAILGGGQKSISIDQLIEE
jgi:hypothetical protein